MTRNNLELNTISALDFTEQCRRIADAYSSDASSVSGEVFAYLAHRLVATELRPGGPYSDKDGKPTIQLNATIGRLFLLMNRPLPNIDAYLKANTERLTMEDREALDLYNSARAAPPKKRSAPRQHASYRRAAKTLSVLEEPAKTQALQFLARIEKADATGEIAAISEFTVQALADINVPPGKMGALGEANVHSWIAYSIYDHILDKEADATLLPTANICMRIAFMKYKQVLPVRHPMQALIAQYFDNVDDTCAWELASCRFEITDDGVITAPTLPDYRQYEALALRSCIHILGPLIAASFAQPASDERLSHLTAGLHHYLIARQLGDDIHDWREDLTAGRISAVVALLLVRQNLPEHSVQRLETLTRAIQKDFMSAGAVQVSNLILEHTQQALTELAAAGCGSSSDLVGLVYRLERMANESIRHQQRFTSFQNSYKPTQPW